MGNLVGEENISFWKENEDEECSVHFSILGDCVTRSLEIIEAETHLVKLHKNAEGEKKLKFNADCQGGNLRNGNSSDKESLLHHHRLGHTQPW